MATLENDQPHDVTTGHGCDRSARRHWSIWLGINVASPILLSLAVYAQTQKLLNPKGELSVFYALPGLLISLCVAIPAATLIALLLNLWLSKSAKRKDPEVRVVVRSIGSTAVFFVLLVVTLAGLAFFLKFNWSEA